MTDFDVGTSLTPRSAPLANAALSEFTWQVPDGWQQGRGAWGGLAIGAMINAATLAEPDSSRSVRSVALQLSAPAVVGSYSISVQPIRIGSRMSTWSVRIVSESDEVIGSAMVVMGSPRPSAAERDEDAWSPLRAPVAPSPSLVPIADTPPPFPPYTRLLEYRVVSGAPLQGGVAETLGWIGLRKQPPWSATLAIALADAWYSATLVAMNELIPISTVLFTAQVLVDTATLTPGDPLLHHGMVTGADEGFISENCRLWSTDGRLVVDSVQTVVVG